MNGVDKGAAIEFFGASFAFDGDAGASARLVLITNPNAPTNTGINVSCIHLPFGRNAMTWQTRTGGTPTNVKTYNFPQALADNGTVYHVAARFLGDTVVTRDPFGVLHRAKDAAFATHSGRYGLFELLYSAGDDGLAAHAAVAQ